MKAKWSPNGEKMFYYMDFNFYMQLIVCQFLESDDSETTEMKRKKCIEMGNCFDMRQDCQEAIDAVKKLLNRETAEIKIISGGNNE